MESLNALVDGFRVAALPGNLLYLFMGVVLGNLVGVLPGIGPVSGTALLVPVTYFLPTETALIMLAGIYYGTMYGGSITAILLNIPGEAASVMTALEGHPLAKQGRAGAALGMSAISSYVAGTLAVVGMMLLASPMADFGLRFGPPEEFALVVAAFTIVAAVGGTSLLKGMAMGALGVLLATIGPTPIVAGVRLTFGVPALEGGMGIVAAAIGLFALPEVLESVEHPGRAIFEKTALKLRNLLPSLQDFKDSALAFPVGTVVGFLSGLVPGAGPTEGSFLTYGIQKSVSPHPERYGRGAMDAIAAVEGANNAASIASLVPMLALGIPGSTTAAILMGAMILHGVQPGPLLFQTNPELVWSLIASMYMGNLVLLILNLPLIGIWVGVMRIPSHIILTSVLAISVVGVYADENSLDNVWIMFVFGVMGYVLKKLDLPPAPVLLALILTNPMETALIRSLTLSQGDWSIFLARPISMGLLGIALVSVVVQIPAVGRLFGRVRRRISGVK